MLGKSGAFGSSSSPSAARTFIYEVKGMQQNDLTESNAYPFRTSDSVFISVPYQRMNEEMRRITRMGGEIVSIRPLEA
ncbi:MAG: phycobilisome linker polypeptide [Spirulina sp.]